MEFTPDDYKRMMFNVSAIPDDSDILDAFPEMKLYQEFSKRIPDGISKNKIIRYICLVYDKNSPFKMKYKDLTQRKVRVIMDVGFEMVDKKFPEEIEDVIKGKTPVVNDMAIAFIKMHNDISYSHLVMMETLYYQKMKDVFYGSADKITEIQKIKESFEAAQKDVFMGDQDKSLLESLYKSINQDKIRLAPEDIAQSIIDKGMKATVEALRDGDD